MSSSIPAAELAQIQSDAASWLDQACVVMRATRTAEPQGGGTLAFSEVASCNVGMAIPTAGQLQNFDYLIGTKASWQVKLPVGTDVLEKDQLVIGARTLSVIKVLSPRSYQALITVLATEVTA
jgi:hypothetical protein